MSSGQWSLNKTDIITKQTHLHHANSLNDKRTSTTICLSPFLFSVPTYIVLLSTCFSQVQGLFPVLVHKLTLITSFILSFNCSSLSFSLSFYSFIFQSSPIPLYHLLLDYECQQVHSVQEHSQKEIWRGLILEGFPLILDLFFMCF